MTKELLHKNTVSKDYRYKLRKHDFLEDTLEDSLEIHERSDKIEEPGSTNVSMALVLSNIMLENSGEVDMGS